MKSFKDHKSAAARIWPRIQSLSANVEGKPARQAKPRKAKRGARAATGAFVKGKSIKKASAAGKSRQNLEIVERHGDVRFLLLPRLHTR